MNPINIIQNVVWIKWLKSRGPTTIPCNRHSMVSTWAIIINFKFVHVRMAVELSANDHMESVNNATIFTRPELAAASTTSRDMRQNMNSFIIPFGSQKSVVEPLHGGLDFSVTVHGPPVEGVAIIVVQSNQSESRSNQNSVVTTKSDSIQGITWKPPMSLPRVC